MERLDLEIASEFVAMASHLLYLKTRMLLSIDDAEVNAEMESLIKSLEERSRMIEYQKMLLGVEYLGHADGGHIRKKSGARVDRTSVSPAEKLPQRHSR